MPRETIQSLTTAEITDISLRADLIKSPFFVLAASNLTTSEVVTLDVNVGQNVFADYKNASGTQYSVTGGALSIEVPNPGVPMQVSKPATASACSVQVSWPSVVQRG